MQANCALVLGCAVLCACVVFVEGNTGGHVQALDDEAAPVAKSAGGEAGLAPMAPAAHDVTSAGATVSWLAPRAQSLSLPEARDITGYRVEVKSKQSAAPVKHFLINGSATTNAMVTGLKPKTQYGLKIVTITKAGQHIQGKSKVFETKASVPGRVPKPTVSKVDYTKLLLSWKEPVHNGRPVSGYHISVQVGGGGDYAPLVQQNVVVESTESTATKKMIIELEPHTVFRFKVAAINSLGKGPESVASKAVSTKRSKVPSATLVKVKEITKHGVTVYWQPAPPNGETVRRYRVYMQTAGVGPFLEMHDVAVSDLPKAKDGLQIRMKKLKPGAKYSFKVAAVNALGLGELSPASKVYVTTMGVPGPPQRPISGSVGGSHLRLVWGPPKHDHGSPILGYRITMQEGGTGGFVEKVANTRTPSTFRTITGLKHGGYSYQFKVQAINRQGAGKASPASSLAITLYDKKQAAARAITDLEGVNSIDEVRNNSERLKRKNVNEKHKADIAVTASRHAKFLARQSATKLERCLSNLKAERADSKRKISAEKKLSVRNLAVQQRMANTKISSERNLMRKKLTASQNRVGELTRLKATLEQQVQTLQAKAEQQDARHLAMKKEGCSLGIKSWCRK